MNAFASKKYYIICMRMKNQYLREQCMQLLSTTASEPQVALDIRLQELFCSKFISSRSSI